MHMDGLLLYVVTAWLLYVVTNSLTIPHLSAIIVSF